MKRLHRVHGFTLVELIVVTTILSILGTIGFISYNWYLLWVRDSNRTTQLREIADGLEIYHTKNALPLPSLSVNIFANGNQIATQWYMGKEQLDLIDYTKWWVDPKDGGYYSYYLTSDRKYFQLLWFLEDSTDQMGIIIPQTYAADYSNRAPVVIGKKLWILTEATSHIPVQQLSLSWGLDIATTSHDYTAWFTDKLSLTGTWITLINSLPQQNCRRLRDTGQASKGSGIYSINPTWTWQINAYCDMESEWWPWTLLLNGTDYDIAKYDARWNSQWNTSGTIPYQSNQLTFKYSDSLINTIWAGWTYKVTASSKYGNDVFYVSPNCHYNHMLGNNGECAKLYDTIDLGTQRTCTGSSWWRGIWCRSKGVIFNHSATSNVLCYNTTSWVWGRCSNHGENIVLQLWVN